MDYEYEFGRLLSMAEQVIPAVDFDKRVVKSFTELRGLKNAVEYYNAYLADKEEELITTTNDKPNRVLLKWLVGGITATIVLILLNVLL